MGLGGEKEVPNNPLRQIPILAIFIWWELGLHLNILWNWGFWGLGVYQKWKSVCNIGYHVKQYEVNM
jgi:hypothetical protein